LEYEFSGCQALTQHLSTSECVHVCLSDSLLTNQNVISGHRLNITAENDCRRLHCSLRDLSSLLQAVGRLAEYFIGDMFAARFNDALTVVER